MKKLTRRFKEYFNSYDYNEQNIDILLSILDTILEMMGIVEMSDHDDIKKLSSFTRLLSSGYSNTIMEAAMIEEIYETSILPILDRFDEKYSSNFVAIPTKEIVNGVPHTQVVTGEEVLNILDDEFNSGKMSLLEYKQSLKAESEKFKQRLVERNKDVKIYTNVEVLEDSPGDFSNIDIIAYNRYIMNNRDTNDPVIHEVIFNMSKDIVGALHNMYDRFTNGLSREHIESYLRDLLLIRTSTEIACKHDNMSIQLICDGIQSICYSLADEFKKNELLPPSSVMLIELKFKAIEGIKYNQ